MVKKAIKDELKINVSFKEKEKELYNFIKSQRSPSNYIKDAVEFYRQNFNSTLVIKKETPHKEEPIQEGLASNLMDF